MADLILQWLINPLLNLLIEFINNDFFASAFENVFFLERMIGIPDDVTARLYQYICSFAWILLTLKLLYKLANVYLFGLDGDPQTAPFSYLKSYAKGVVIILTFTVVYDWLYNIVDDLGSGLLGILESQQLTYTSGNALLRTIFMLIYLVMACVIYIQFLMNGCRLLVLRMGMPFACTGLIDNDNGVYNVFVKKLIQTCSTVIVQIFLVRISLIPITSMTGYFDLPYVNVMMSVAILAYSMKVAQDLNELFLSSAASGAGYKMSSIGRGVQSLVSVFKH